jgi:hypothetical protein
MAQHGVVRAILWGETSEAKTAAKVKEPQNRRAAILIA